MGNCSSCCKDTPCYLWMFPKKPNLPTKPQPGERPKPITPPIVELEETTVFSRRPPEFLVIKEWDWLPKINGASHHTSSYSLMNQEKPQLVVRRGQEFSLKITTNRRYSPDTDRLGIILTVADSKNPSFGNQTQVGIAVGAIESDRRTGSGWTSDVTDVQDTCFTLLIGTSSSAIIGEWKFEVDVQSSTNIHNFPAPSTFYLLFNPWSEEDNVYVEEDDRRKEYVEDDVGMIWRGTHNRLRPIIWQFGQYDEDVLPCILHVLRSVSSIIPANRADPIRVSRAISAGVNSPDDNGVLVGNWSGEYEGGITPTQWSGSIKILQQFYKNKSPVKFGQCWVFSGVLTTACRALGIPCRPITNFSSAHDTHNSLTIDYFFDEEGEEIERLNSDSIWNFHVWNECWMRRPDLGETFDGWQVVDATPQEESDGQYRCGPASLIAIKNGEIHKSYDVPFVYAEVNADKLFWKYRGANCPMKLLGRKTRGVGLNVSTKAVGRWAREDVTHLYKHEEDSSEERTVMKEALRRCENVFARYYLNEELEDVEFDLKLLDDIVIGEPFSVSAEVHNKSSTEYDISVFLRADAMLYTGAVKGNVKKQQYNITIQPHSKKDIKLNVSFDEYYKNLVDQCAMNISCLASVKQTEFEYFAQDDFRVRKPDINIKLDGDLVCGEVTNCTAYFPNPLPMKLTRARFYVLPSKAESSYCRLKLPVDAKGEAKCEFQLKPKSAGEMTVSVTFRSKELEDVDGFLTCEVKTASESTQPNAGNDDAAPPQS